MFCIFLHLFISSFPMKKMIFIFCAMICCSGNIIAQSACLPEGITFTSQAQIDNFPVDYPGCTKIAGYVRIWGGSIDNLYGLSGITRIGADLSIQYNSPLSNLNGLSSLDSIMGSFIVKNSNSLTSLAGLDSLKFVGGNLQIENNNSLTNLTGLEVIQTINGEMHVHGNNNLISLTGLENINSLSSGLVIDENDMLPDLQGLNNLEHVAYISIDFNMHLINLEGLNNLQTVNGGLFIESNNSLKDFSGLANLISVNGLQIYSNDSLASLSGMNSLTSVNGDLVISYNFRNLTSLAGIDSLDASTFTAIEIRENWHLSTCNVKSICDYLARPDAVTEIYDNDPGCNTQEEVEAACFAETEDLTINDFCSVSPNPVRDIADFRLQIADFGKVTLNIYDIRGQKVATLLDQNLSPGSHQVAWNTSSVIPGLYFYQFSEIRKEKLTIGKIVVKR
jgi:hypothetical protein